MLLGCLNMHKKEFSVVSLFSGAGGMDLGFDRQGFKTIWANDFDKDACETHRKWSKATVVYGDISKINVDDIPASDVILGGFPCQGFSLAGPRKIDDQRNKLYSYFVRLVEKKQPYAFVAENVKGILTLGGGTIFEAILADFESKGYKIIYKLVNAADYGVPQDRWRVIMVGIRKNLGIDFSFPEQLENRVKLVDVLQDLPDPSPEDICNASYSSRYMSRNRRRNWHEVSYTIPAMAKQVPLHPASAPMTKINSDLWEFGTQLTRRLSWQEAAAIQTFPPQFEFAGNLTSKYKQIGNAVPVHLAEAIAGELYKSLKSILIVKNNGLNIEVGA